MIGAVCFKVTNEYEVRIYMVGTYEQIDWTNPSPCVLGENYTCYALKNEEAGNAIQIVTGLNGQHMLRLFETKRYILRLVYEENLDIEVPRFQNENNKFLKLEKDKDYITFQFVNYLGYSRINFTHDNCGQQIVFEIAPEKMNYEEDYIVLTEAIAQVCSELLLEYSGLTSNLFEQSEEEHRTILNNLFFLGSFVTVITYLVCLKQLREIRIVYLVRMKFINRLGAEFRHRNSIHIRSHMVRDGKKLRGQMGHLVLCHK